MCGDVELNLVPDCVLAPALSTTGSNGMALAMSHPLVMFQVFDFVFHWRPAQDQKSLSCLSFVQSLGAKIPRNFSEPIVESPDFDFFKKITQRRSACTQQERERYAASLSAE